VIPVHFSELDDGGVADPGYSRGNPALVMSSEVETSLDVSDCSVITNI
jgi:hypothetical protein